MKAFTLIELLVVCAIVAILAAIVFPVFAQAKAAAKSTVCIAQEHQIGAVLALYSSDHDDGAPTAGESGEENGELELNGDSWLDDVEPYVHTSLIYRCPMDHSEQWDALVSPRQTSYGLNSYFAPNHPPFFGFSLGLATRPAQCVLVGELADSVSEDHFSAMYWGNPSRCQDDAKQKDQWDKNTEMPKTVEASRHGPGSNYIFVDLHVKKMRFGQLWRQTPGSLPNVDDFDPSQ